MGYHIIAIIVVLIWGVTFVNSKVLLNHGLMAHEIFTLRFLLAYLCIWIISPRRLFARSWKDEGLMLLLGITGGSLYFVTENMAVKVGYCDNVSFIVCTAPLLTTLLALMFVRNVRATKGLVVGSLLAVCGVAMVVFNGHFVLKLNPLGDALAFSAALCWAVYSLLMRKVSHYESVFITRKVFFYGLLTVLPVYIVRPWNFPAHGFAEPAVWGNLLFLGLVASFSCYALWTLVIKKIGAVRVSNYIYLNPVSTVVASALVLGESLTWLSGLGSLLILAGVWLAAKNRDYEG
ncbi:MAG: DMT family transporter [Prevotella sp.]|nr:DMT family transporter [Prevotella sp.]